MATVASRNVEAGNLHPVDVDWNQIQGARSRQEDLAFAEWHRGALVMALSDGMGGHPHGDVASRVTIETVRAHVCASAPRTPDQWNEALHIAVENAHAAVNALGERHAASGRRPGAALIALVLIPSLSVWTYAAVGHGFIYRRTSRGKLEQVNQRHCEEQYRLTSCIGAGHSGLAQVDGRHQIRLMGPHDAFLLASNGIDVLDPLEIETLLDIDGPAKWMSRALLSRVERKASPDQDNATVVTACLQRERLRN